MVDSCDQKCRHCTLTPPQAGTREGVPLEDKPNKLGSFFVFEHFGALLSTTVITFFESWQYSGHDMPQQMKDDRFR